MNATGESWPFDQPPNCAVITQRQIMDGDAPILYVSHDQDDHGWQFLDGGLFHMADALLVSLKSVVDLDPSLFDIADMPPGWCATRDTAFDPWKRSPHGDE